MVKVWRILAPTFACLLLVICLVSVSAQDDNMKKQVGQAKKQTGNTKKQGGARGAKKFGGRRGGVRKQAGNGGSGSNSAPKSNPNLNKVTFANNVTGTFQKTINLRALEELAMEDPIGQEWLEFGQDRMNSPTAQRYAQIKTMILAFQEWQSFGKYDYYGCYCFPEGQNLALGVGLAQDNIDAACKRWMNCMSCIEMDSHLTGGLEEDGSCDAITTPYAFNAIRDDENNAKIKCLPNGPHGSCARATCECDAEFVESMTKLEADGQYIIDHHEVWGNFDRENKCSVKKDANSPVASARSLALKNKKEKEGQNKASESIQKQMNSTSSASSHGQIDSCCVIQYPNFSLFRSMTQKCCYSQQKNSFTTHVYHPGSEEKEGYDCCFDGTVARAGECDRKQHDDL